MTPTNKLRFVERIKIETVNSECSLDKNAINITLRAPTVKILQQWWEGFGSDTAINYAHPDAHKLSKNPPGEWRDVEVVNE